MVFDQPGIGIITQVRMTSTRLPGKVLMKIKNKSLLQYHIERLQQTGLEIIIATTTNASDDCIFEFASINKIKIYRGSENNVLKRYFETATEFSLNTIIRVTSDCPLIDPLLIRKGLEKYLRFNNPDLYLSNTVNRTFARGFDFEVFSYKSLKDAFENAKEDLEIEHVTPYIWNNKSGKTKLFHIKQLTDNSRFRLTVDTQEDFVLISQLIVKYNADKLSYTEIENLLKRYPELVEINAHIGQKKI